MSNTLVGYFDSYDDARQTEQDLVNSGFSIEDVQIVAKDAATTGQTTEAPGMWERFKSALGFASEEERVTYEEAARHGGALLTVRVAEEQANQVADLIERHHPVDIDRRIEEWRGEQGTPTEAPRAVDEAAESTPVGQAGIRTSDTSIPIAQEELLVGKRLVQRGAVRIHTYVTERPVAEQVRLKEQQAFVERHPVAPVVAGEEAFQERIIEVEETGEEAAVAKQARVVEELEVGKAETERTETVQDTVRKTEVEIERARPKKPD
jgi:uncharacterized protein (TIGR02271 family)